MKYYLIAGEVSGDMHGANLMKALAKRDREAQFRGFGGNAMKAAGLHLVTHHRDMDFVGLVGLLGHLKTIYLKLKQCKKDILRYQPHVVILIDFGGFNMRVAKLCHRKGIRVFYYISPKVWVWGRSRALQLKAHVDRMFCILPFEKKFYGEFDWEVDYVGNPILDAVNAFRPNPGFLDDNALDKERPIIALLPGSRRSELSKIVPLFVEIIALHSEYQFVVATVSSMPADMYAPFSACANTKLITDATYDLLAHAHAAVVTSGTATLETGLFKVPQLVVYKAKPLEYFIASLLINLRYMSLVNLIGDRTIVKEYLQKEATAANLNSELKVLIENTEYRERMREGYEQVYQMLNVGSASNNTAQLMTDYLKTQHSLD